MHDPGQRLRLRDHAGRDQSHSGSSAKYSPLGPTEAPGAPLGSSAGRKIKASEPGQLSDSSGTGTHGSFVDRARRTRPDHPYPRHRFVRRSGHRAFDEEPGVAIYDREALCSFGLWTDEYRRILELSEDGLDGTPARVQTSGWYYKHVAGEPRSLLGGRKDCQYLHFVTFCIRLNSAAALGRS